MRRLMKRIAYLLITVFLSANQPSTVGRTTMNEAADSSSFETDFDGWSIRATDVWGDPPEAWSITRSQEMARDGNTSLKFFLANSNDAEKIWIEKPFEVEPNQIYRVTVEYALASVSPVSGAGTAFRIITGAMKNSPNTREELRPAYKDAATNGTEESGYKWLDKQYEFTVRSDERATLFVVIGIWGDWEVRRTFYFDSTRVTICKKPEGAEFYSFENDFDGWNPKATDLEFGSQSIEWSVARVQQFALGGEDGKYSINFDLNSLNQDAKVWMEKPFAAERGRKYRVGVDYAFHTNDCAGAPRFRILTGVFRRAPESGEDLINAVQEKTVSTGCTWGWLHKNYDFTIKAKKTDALYVIIGIWGTQKAHRTYNVDSVCVSITPK
jgi:hypothetical protein